MHVLPGTWPARATWALLPLLVGPALGEALSSHSLAVARTASVLAWGTWAGVLVAVLLPRTVSLTALRIAAPAALGHRELGRDRAASAAPPMRSRSAGAALAVVAAFSPSTGEEFVNGSSYGDEERLPLRVPTPLLFGPLPLAGIAAVAGPIAGPLLLAARQWVLGAVVAGRRPAGRRRRGPARSTAWLAAGSCSCRPAWCCTTRTRWSSPCCSPGGRSGGSGPRPPSRPPRRST